MTIILDAVGVLGDGVTPSPIACRQFGKFLYEMGGARVVLTSTWGSDVDAHMRRVAHVVSGEWLRDNALLARLISVLEKEYITVVEVIQCTIEEYISVISGDYFVLSKADIVGKYFSGEDRRRLVELIKEGNYAIS